MVKKTIDMTPTWTATAQMINTVVKHGTGNKEGICEEILKMGQLLDGYKKTKHFHLLKKNSDSPKDILISYYNEIHIDKRLDNIDGRYNKDSILNLIDDIISQFKDQN